MGALLRSIIARVYEFPRANRGNIAMIFGVALIPLCLAAGVGLDMSRAMITHARIATALDAAGLAVGTQPGLNEDAMQKLAQQYFTQNYTADVSQYGKPTAVVVDRPDGSQTITLSTSVAMPTILMRLAGLDTMTVAAQSQITWGQTKLWVGLVLDNTGSMCEPDSQPCPSPSDGTKIVQLKKALLNPTTGLVDILKNAAAYDGDVKVSIVPFSKDVTYAADASGADTVNASWIDWKDWEAEPPNKNVQPDSSVGPGSACPYTTATFGFGCLYTQSSKIATTGANKGMVCPGTDNGTINKGDGVSTPNRASHHYNGCYNSVPTNTQTTTTTVTTKKTQLQNCKTVNGGATSCTNNGSAVTDPSQTDTNTQTTSGYVGPDSNTSATAAPVTTTDGNQTCTSVTVKKVTTTTCNWSRTIVTNTTKTTIVITGVAPFNHTWLVNAHSTWKHCFMDRPQPDDVNTFPGNPSNFPAENSDACPPAGIAGLGYNWTALTDEINGMAANGNTNQTVGLAWGWQTLTSSDPFGPGALPVDTRKYIIMLTDGLNTQNATSATETVIDARTKAICDKIKGDGITIYTVYVNLNPPKTPDAGQLMLQGCASTGDFYALTSATAIPDTFQHIATEITNLRVSL